MATLDETRRVHDWALEQVLEAFTKAPNMLNRTELEAEICSRATSKMASSFVVRSTINVLLALNVLIPHQQDECCLLKFNSEQAKCMESIDHYSHLLFKLKQERAQLAREERDLLRRVLALHRSVPTAVAKPAASASTGNQRKRRSEPAQSPSTAAIAREEEEGDGECLLMSHSAAEKRIKRDEAIARVRHIQIQLHSRRGLLESTLLAHPMQPALAPSMQVGPLGAGEPASKGANASATMASASASAATHGAKQQRYPPSSTASAGDGKRGLYEVDLRSTSVDFASFVAAHFEPWIGGGGTQQHEYETRTNTPRAHTPRAGGSPSPSHTSAEKPYGWSAIHPCMPPPQQPSASGLLSKVRIPQWKVAAPVAAMEGEDQLTAEELQEELELQSTPLLLQRHDKVLLGIRAQFDHAEEERKLNLKTNSSSSGSSNNKSAPSRTSSGSNATVNTRKH